MSNSEFHELLKKDSWTLDEAVNALIVPGDDQESLHEVAQRAILADTLKHTKTVKTVTRHWTSVDSMIARAFGSDPTPQPSKDYQVETYFVAPRAFLEWAVNKGYSIPQPLEVLFERTPTPNPGAEATKQSAEKRKTDMLGAALWCLANHPKDCLNTRKRITGESLFHAVMNWSGVLWPESATPPITSSRNASDLYNTYLRKAEAPKIQKKRPRM